MRIGLILLFAFAFNSSAEEFGGRTFALGKSSDGPLYTQKIKIEQQPDGTTVTSGDMVDGSGKLVLREHAISSGTTLISQEIENYVEHKEYRATFKDQKVVFETYSMKEGEEKKRLSSRRETIRGTMLSGVTTENFIRENWEALVNGKRVDFRFAVFERQETIGFSFKKKAETDVDGKSAIVLSMRPTSFFVAMVVAPIEISVDKENKTIIHYKGRTPIKTEKNKNLEAEVVYDRHTPSISRATASQKRE